jgi:membrane dipeptidase
VEALVATRGQGAGFTPVSREPHAAPADAGELAAALGISREAAELYLGSEVIDLHVDSFIWTRLLGYRLGRRHGRGLFGARFYSQVDFPRIRQARIGGALWSITTNPWRTSAARADAFAHNLTRLRACFDAEPDVALVRSASEYRAARAAGRHAAFVAIQGGNALDRDLDALSALRDGSVIAVTVMHMSVSKLGVPSTSFAREDTGLTAHGRAYVERLNELRVFVDLAHASARTFADAVVVHDRSQPLLVSHTGVSGVQRSWRNLDDDQLRAVADTGGVVGVIFHGGYLGGQYLGGGRASRIVDHLAHLIDVAGEDAAALGSDWDGLIATPRDMPTCVELPRLVQLMLDRGFSPARVRKVLGGNFLRALSMLRD